MTTKRILEIQKETAYPDSLTVQQALLKVWNECSQEQPEVVRCKDCKYYMKEAMGLNMFCQKTKVYRKKNFYCKDGEKK